jgi:hypothetical protein
MTIQPSTTTHIMGLVSSEEIIKFCKNGDIFVKGKLAENDKEVVDAFREFLTGQGFINLNK